MIYDIAKPIALEVWKDPQNFVITHHVRDEAWLYFRCWKSPGENADYIGCLHFEGVWHINSTRFTATKGYPNVAETDLHSYYLTVDDSSLLESLKDQRANHDAEWEAYDHRKYRHYIVESHDFYTDIIAARVTFSTLEGPQAKPFFDVWEQI